MLKPLFMLVAILLLGGCTTTPVPLQHNVVSVSWVNPTPVSYRLIETSVCSSSNTLLLEGLPAYSEKAQSFDGAVKRNCKVTVSSVIGSKTNATQTSWLPSEKERSVPTDLHLRITVYPHSPPQLILEPVAIAERRLKSAGRSVEKTDASRN